MSLRLLVSLTGGLVALAVVGYVGSLAGTGPGTLEVGATAAVAAPGEPAPALAPAAMEGPDAVSPAWLAATAARAGLPVAALRAYATAQLRVAGEDERCRLGWTTLAAIGWVESQHGAYQGRTLGEDGVPSTPILGPTLDGSGDVAAVPGGSGEWARAAGPMQFIPSTWASWAADGDGDGVANVQDLDDSAYAAGRYLCAAGAMDTGAGWARAVFSYNHSQAYVDQVYAAAQAYGSRVG